MLFIQKGEFSSPIENRYLISSYELLLKDILTLEIYTDVNYVMQVLLLINIVSLGTTCFFEKV